MKTQIRFTLFGGIVVLFLLFTACRKDNDLQTQAPEPQKTNAIGNKVFTGNIIQKVFTNYNGSANFANNTGNNNFTGSGIPGPGSSSTGNGSFTYNNKTYPLIFGGFDDYSDGWFEIIFADQGFNMDEEPIDINAVGFDIRSGSSNEIVAGHYTFSHSGNPYTFDWAAIAIHANTGQEEYYDFINGDLNISKSGNIYSFEFWGILDNGKPVTGYFSGTLIDLDAEPDPIPTFAMNADVNGVYWQVNLIYSYTNQANTIIIVYGENGIGDYISLEMYKSQVFSGAFLGLGDGLVSAQFGNYNSGDIYSATDEGSVYVSNYSFGVISGSFSFAGENISGQVANVFNGVFTNVPVSE